MKLNTPFHPEPRLRINGTIPLFYHMFSKHAKQQLQLYDEAPSCGEANSLLASQEITRTL
jgi:hypothetical protein